MCLILHPILGSNLSCFRTFLSNPKSFFSSFYTKWFFGALTAIWYYSGVRVKINMASITEDVIAAPLLNTFIFEYSNEENRWVMHVDQLKL